MARKRKSQQEERARNDGGAVFLLLAITVVASMIVVDSRAEATFDAPKRLAVTLGVAAASIAFVIRGGERPSLAPSNRIVGWLLVAAAILGAFSVAFSPHRHVAIDAARMIVLVAPALVLAASLEPHDWRTVIDIFVGAAVLNAVLSLMQHAGMIRLFNYATVGGRKNTSAMFGNDGVLALVLTVAASAAAASLMEKERRSPLRIAALIILVVAAILNRNLTSLVALAAVAAFLTVRRFRVEKKFVIGSLAMVLIAIALIRFVAPTSARFARFAGVTDVATVDRLLSYRFGPWAASLEMIADRPLLGYGPGTFASEFMTHRLEAEKRWRTRLENPFLPSGAYGEAHNDSLQLAAEWGVPATLALGAALAILLISAMRAEDPDLAIPAAILLCLVVASLSWFPLQRPTTALIGLIAAGRIWRSR